MNCPSRNETEPDTPPTHNQSPPALAAETTTREDLNGRANSREIGAADDEGIEGDPRDADVRAFVRDGGVDGGFGGGKVGEGVDGVGEKGARVDVDVDVEGGRVGGGKGWKAGNAKEMVGDVGVKAWNMVKKYASFIGPGFMVAVAYIDPGNYATDVAAGASYRFKLLFIILMSNLFAIFLQSLCVKLGSVTGLNLAENCKAHCPRWLNYILWIFAEAAIIATDIAEVIGTAIALNILLKIPLVAGCAISIVDVLIILVWYRPSGSMKGLRAFEIFVMALVLGVVICFCFQLSLIENTGVEEVFRGYLPSSAIVESQGLYQSCGILGATVMPHSLFLGSGIVQARLRHFDEKEGNLTQAETNNDNDATDVPEEDTSDTDSITSKYRPSLAAIKNCMNYSILEMAFSLFTFALFVNSSILIVAGASLYGHPEAEDADLFSIHDLLASSLAPAAGTIFAVALLLSGTSAGIVCTIAGQMVAEGMLNWRTKPWIRRLVTRSISITPSIIIAGAVGRPGLSAALEGTQVALSVILPFVSAPLIWFTCRGRYMAVAVEDRGMVVGEGEERAVAARVPERAGDEDERAVGTADLERRNAEEDSSVRCVQMKNHWFTSGVAVVIWLVIVVMNVALLVLVGMGKS